MRGFHRRDALFSLCGLNCGLCPMRLGGHCTGCGEGSQSCRLARCSLDHGGMEYCYQCGEYPCGRYADIDEFDSFITHQNRRADMEKARRMGPAAYQAEQAEKVNILQTLLSRYNDGRKKTLYCVAANLLELDELQGALQKAESGPPLPDRERCARMAEELRAIAEKKGIELKLRKRK